MRQPERIKLQEHQIIIPYSKNRPIMTLDNPTEGQVDLFVRCRYHTGIGSWFSDVDPDNTGQTFDMKRHPRRGAIVFVPRVLKIGEGVVISRVFSSGNSASGTIIMLPETLEYPYDHDTRKLPKLFRP